MSAGGVIGTIGLVVASTESANIIKKRSLSMRPIIGGFLLGLFLFPLDSFQPKISKAVQILLVTGALVANGSSMFAVISKAPSTAKN